MNADTPPPSSAPVADDELHAMIDGLLQPAVWEALEQRLLQQPEAAARLSRWREQRAVLRQLHSEVLTEPVPQAMRDALQRSTVAQRRAQTWWRWGGMAASVLVAFGVGWVSHMQWGPGERPPTLAVSDREFTRQAAVAHVVFAPEVRHPVEVTAADQAHLVQWLSKRLGKPLSVPQLAEQGYRLIGGRLLPGADGARAQFMYQDAKGTRLTLYVGAVDISASGAGRESAFRFTDEGLVPGFYWVDQGFGYALSGPLSRESLSALAQVVYRQL
jgi:anti-sigma factor RsiW